MNRQDLNAAPAPAAPKHPKPEVKNAKLKIGIAAAIFLAAGVVIYLQFGRGPRDDNPVDPQAAAQAAKINELTADPAPPPVEEVRQPVSRRPIKREP